MLKKSTPKMSNETLVFFRKLPFVSNLPKESFQAFTQSLQRLDHGHGTRFVTQGEEGDAAYFIEQGDCNIIISTGGQEYTVATRTRGDLVGEMALVTDELRQAHVEAKTDVVLWRLEKSDFVRLVTEHSYLRLFLTELVSKRLEVSSHVADRTIGKYKIQHKLGNGAWAIVYDGVHISLGKRVAIKMLKHQMAMVPEFHERFLKEAEIIARLAHRNIIDVYDVEDRFNTLFIVMELLQGEALDTKLKRKGALPVAEVVDILIQVCTGLAYAHGLDIVHQDIKPENIFIQENGVVKILDFGLACPFGSENFEMEGTLQYMSPEQIDSYPVDARTDMYCLGITAFELLAGQPPYPGDDLTALMDLHLNADIPDPATVIEGIPKQLASFIRTCCKRKASDRFQTADAALQSLTEIEQALREVEPVAVSREHMSSLHFFYNEEQKTELRELLEDFSSKIKMKGIGMALVDFENYLKN